MTDEERRKNLDDQFNEMIEKAQRVLDRVPNTIPEPKN